MKKKLLVLAACSLSGALAHADSVVIYGLIDAGLTRYSDVASSHGATSLTKVDTGVANASRIGFKGTEDLGGGTSAFFTLETGYNLDDGSLGQGGAIFGRQAFIGLTNAQYGSVSVGRHYDFMINQNAYSTGAATVAGLLAFGLHASPRTNGAMNDRIYAGDRVNNSIKYQSPRVAGFSAGVMYGVGEVAGNSSAGRSYSGRVAYDNGPLSAAFAVTDLHDVAGLVATRIYGLGGGYTMGRVRVYSLLTQVENNTLTNPKVNNYEIGSTWAATPVIDLSVGYQRQKRNNNVEHADQLTLVADYKLSKRTDVYFTGAFLHDGGYLAQTTAAVGVPSSDNSQNALRIGLRHMF